MANIFDNPYYRQFKTDPYASGYYQGVKPYEGLQTQGMSMMSQQAATPQVESPEAGGKMDWGGMMGNVGAGLAAGQGNDSEEGAYSIDPNAGFKGSFKGLASGGPIGAIVGGITSQIGTFSKVNKNLKELRPDIGGYQVDANGNPVFNSGAFLNANRTVRELDAGERKIAKAKDPATHAFNLAFGTRKKLNDKYNQMQAAIYGEKQMFNQQNLQFQNQQMARRAYEDQISNVYGINNRYY